MVEKPKRLSPEEQEQLIKDGQYKTTWTTRTLRRLKSNTDIAWLLLVIGCSFLAGFASCFVLIAMVIWLFEIQPANAVAFFIALFTWIVSTVGAWVGSTFKLSTKPGTIAKRLQRKADKAPEDYDDSGRSIPIHRGGGE